MPDNMMAVILCQGGLSAGVAQNMMNVMPWTDEHKERTRERIVRAAAAAVRARGVDGVSIAEIMAEAGLTHGGFYAHFASKEDLLRAALESASGQTLDMLSEATQSIPADQRINAAVDAYLSPKHAAHPERGCPIAALGPELSRLPGHVRHDLSLRIGRRIEALKNLLPLDARAEEDATAVLACMVGGLVLARVVDPERSAAVLDATRAFVRRGLAHAGKRATARKPNARSKSTRRRSRA